MVRPTIAVHPIHPVWRLPMSVSRSARLASAAALALSLGAASTVAAQAPAGQGLAGLADQGISSLVCSDPTIGLDDVTLPRGGGRAVWIDDGRMFLVQSLEITGTVTTPEGSFPVSFTKTYGAGASSATVTCTFDQVNPEEGFAGTGTVTLTPVR